jgi:hypothetical protein
MSEIGPTFITILTSVVGLAMLAVVLSKKAQTSSVVQAGGTALASVIGAAVAPLGGGNAGATSFGTPTLTGGVAP